MSRTLSRCASSLSRARYPRFSEEFPDASQWEEGGGAREVFENPLFASSAPQPLGDLTLPTTKRQDFHVCHRCA